MLAAYDHQIEKNRQVIAASTSIDKDMKLRLEKTTSMLIPLRKTLAELSKREHLLQKKLLMLKLHAKVAKIEEMKAQLQKDEQAHEIEEKRLAQQKAQHDKHLAEIAKHLSVLSAEEQGVLPGSSRDDDDDDDDDDDGNGEDDAGEDASEKEDEDVYVTV